MKGLSQIKLRLLFSAFFLLLAIPSAVLSYKAYEKIKWEALYQYQQLAQDLVVQINNSLNDMINKEEAHSDTDYAFLVVKGDPSAGYLQPSPLSSYPVESNLPGVLGYFQVDAEGQFSTPLLPNNIKQIAKYGITDKDTELRQELALQLRDVLFENQLVEVKNTVTQQDDITQNELEQVVSTFSDEQDAGIESTRLKYENAEAASEVQVNKGNTGFVQLQTPEQQRKIVSDLGLTKEIAQAAIPLKEKLISKKELRKTSKNKKRSTRVESNYQPQVKADSFEQELQGATASAQINLFKSKIAPFRFSLLQSGHLVVYRQVWRNQKQLIQGAIIQAKPFFKVAMEKLYRQSSLAQSTNLNLTYGDSILTTYFSDPGTSYLREKNGAGEIILNTTLVEPFNHLSVVFEVTNISTGESARTIMIIAIFLIIALVFGTYALYRLTYKQTQLAQQHQDFISSVSHELKTPLTAIKLYGDILQEGWMEDAKKTQYYTFISSEADRLTRLISNILQISKINHNALDLNLRVVKTTELISLIESKIDSQIKQAGFTLNLTVSPECDNASVELDTDAFIQIIINLVDNGVKYSAKSKLKQIDVGFKISKQNTLDISVRDHGPGIPKKQAKKVFELFYRIGNELTRESKGTGIGLALVKELVQSLGGKITLITHEKGAEFVIKLPLRSD